VVDKGDCVFRAAFKELCARIWIELEFLAHESCPPQDVVMSSAVLRLELVVLLDWCRSAHWRSCISSAKQRDGLCSMLTDVLAALYVDSNDLRSGIAAAQDRVLDELVPESDDESSPAEPTSDWERAPGTQNAVHELMSLIEARAPVRASVGRTRLRGAGAA
jgi:hypothetical protein